MVMADMDQQGADIRADKDIIDLVTMKGGAAGDTVMGHVRTEGKAIIKDQTTIGCSR